MGEEGQRAVSCCDGLVCDGESSTSMSWNADDVYDEGLPGYQVARTRPVWYARKKNENHDIPKM